jgi:hypothetical protein
MTEWQPIETAPRDGTIFIGRNADNPSFGSWPMMRRVKHQWDDAKGDFVILDLGAWLSACDNEPDVEDGGDCGQGFPYSIAPDKYNKSVRYEWTPLPGGAEK